MESDRETLNEDLSELTKVEPMRRIELITGAERRRNRSRDEKVAIVAESMVPGAVIAHVARRHGVSPQQLYGWRSTFKASANKRCDPAFARAVVDGSLAADLDRNDLPVRPETPNNDGPPSIELTIGRAQVVFRGAVDQRTLAAVLKALKGLT
jgi:transposase